jgi:hypothetical protein
VGGFASTQRRHCILIARSVGFQHPSLTSESEQIDWRPDFRCHSPSDRQHVLERELRVHATMPTPLTSSILSTCIKVFINFEIQQGQCLCLCKRFKAQGLGAGGQCSSKQRHGAVEHFDPTSCDHDMQRSIARSSHAEQGLRIVNVEKRR